MVNSGSEAWGRVEMGGSDVMVVVCKGGGYRLLLELSGWVYEVGRAIARCAMVGIEVLLRKV